MKSKLIIFLLIGIIIGMMLGGIVMPAFSVGQDYQYEIYDTLKKIYNSMSFIQIKLTYIDANVEDIYDSMP